MSQWICIKCGATATSKCPSQRSVFYGMEQGLLNQAVAIQLAKKNEYATEVFLNVTVNSEGNPVEKSVELLQHYKERLAQNACNHRWILNSETERVCSLGCEHYNLTDKERLLKEISPPETKEELFSYAELQQTYASIFSYILGRVTTDVPANIEGMNLDERRQIYREMEHLKEYTMQNYRAIKLGKSFRKTYRIAFGYKSVNEDLFTDSHPQAYMLWVHYSRLGELCWFQQLNLETGSYETVVDVLDPRETCTICGKPIDIGERTRATGPTDPEQLNEHDLPLGSCHEKCFQHQQNLNKCIVRSVVMTPNNEETEALARVPDMFELARRFLRMRGHNVREILDVHYINRGMTKLRIRVRALGRIIEDMKSEG